MMKRRFAYRALFIALGIALVGLVTMNNIVSAAPPGIRWSGSTNVSNTGTKSVYPVTSVDGAGKVHVAWIEYASNEGDTNSRLMYTNNVNGSYRSAFEVTDDAGENKDHILAIAVASNQVHVAYTDRNVGIRHTIINLDNGRPSAGTTTRLISNAKGYMPSLIADKSGRVHVAWIDNRSGGYRVYHRVWTNGNWEGGDRQVTGGAENQIFPSLAATDDGNVHILFKNGTRMYYGIFQNNGWQSKSSPSNDQTNQQALAADGTRVYAVWSTRAHVVKYNEGVNGDWSGERQLSTGDQWSDQPYIFYSPANNRIYALWAARLTSSTNTSIVIREIQQGGISSDALKIGEAPGNWPRGAGGSSGIFVSWQDKSSGSEEVIVRGGVPGEPSGGEVPPTPVNTGTPEPTVTGGPTVTPTVAPSITPTVAPTAPAPTPTVTPPPPNVPATGSFNFADSAFADLWNRTDSLVARNAVPYSWLWGPTPFTGGVGEYYVQSPNQVRSVQYFDKSRMEINNPNSPRDQWYVTNGRLADELITGLMQVGDAQYEQRQPAAVAVAGDPQNTFPLYRDLQSVYKQSYNSDRANQELYRAPDGSVKTQLLANANTDPSMVITQRINGLGIPKIFWDFMNTSGEVVENGNVTTAIPLYDWRYVVGEPITEAYWTFINVGGVQHGVLVQAFERRVLTFQPDNPPEFQVEMGNIGLHYFEWRYGGRPR